MKKRIVFTGKIIVSDEDGETVPITKFGSTFPTHTFDSWEEFAKWGEEREAVERSISY